MTPKTPAAPDRPKIPVPDAGARVMDVLPAWEEIPAEFKGFHAAGRWSEVVRDWIFRGLRDAVWTPKPGVDTAQALAAVRSCLASWEPSYEHKEAGCAYLLSLWFEGVVYTAGSVH